MVKKVNAIGDACPIPVVKTKNAIKELVNGGTVETLVDNEIAVQNLTKMANQKGYGVTSEKINDNEYKVVMTVGESAESTQPEEAAQCIPDMRSSNKVVVLSSNCMGSGDDVLGAKLMKAYVFALTQLDELPSTILCYNGGVKLTTADAETVDDLKSLEAQGVEILSCGTCLDFYGLKDQLKVGGVTNMYVIAETMMNAGLVMKP